MIRTILALFMLGSGAAHASSVRVIDGDGFMLGNREIRLWGIDAPELSQECRKSFWKPYPCGKHSKDFLGEILGGSEPVCRTITRDRHGRHVSRCTVKGVDVAALMVRNGWALDYPRYSGGKYHKHQAAAQAAKLGVWQGRFDLPWKWRDMVKKQQPLKKEIDPRF